MLLVVLSCVFYGSFFAFGYAIPLSLVCVLYGMMLHRLRNRKAPSSSASAAASAVMAANKTATGTTGNGDTTAKSRRSSSKRRVTRLVIVVVVIFAVSWLPAQVRQPAAESALTNATNVQRLSPNCTENAFSTLASPQNCSVISSAPRTHYDLYQSQHANFLFVYKMLPS